jgi:flavin-binding protein dodecin
MAESVYKVVEIVGTSTESWAKAAEAAVTEAAKSVRDLRIAEVVQMDMTLKDGKVEAYRVAPEQYVQGILAGERGVLSRFISLLEPQLAEARDGRPHAYQDDQAKPQQATTEAERRQVCVPPRGEGAETVRPEGREGQSWGSGGR